MPRALSPMKTGTFRSNRFFSGALMASPMGRRSDYEQVRITDLVGQIVSVVVRQRALARFAASHASRAGSDPAVADMDQLGIRPRVSEATRIIVRSSRFGEGYR